MNNVKAKATDLSPPLDKTYRAPPLPQPTVMLLSVCIWIRGSSQVSLTNPHNDHFLHVSSGYFLPRPAPGASPRAQAHSLGVDRGTTSLSSKTSALFLPFFSFQGTN